MSAPRGCGSRRGRRPRCSLRGSSATVAPGIAEALIATAIGLFAAIPAVIAYNRFAARGQALAGRYYAFANELQARLLPRLHAGAPNIAVAAA